MGLRRVKKYLIAHMVARVVYLFCATIICVGMILDVIMAVNIVLPYLRVVGYVPTNCTVRQTIIANKQGCDACPKANTTTEPCIQVYIQYPYQFNGTDMTAIALLHMNEYNVLDDDICSYKTSCTAFYWQNEVSVEEFRQEYGIRASFYPCSYDPTNPDRVIVRQENSSTEVMHALLWPSLAILIGFVLVVIFYCWVGCDIWGSRIATVMWDKSLKRIEAEQEKRRRQGSQRSITYEM